MTILLEKEVVDGAKLVCEKVIIISLKRLSIIYFTNVKLEGEGYLLKKEIG